MNSGPAFAGLFTFMPEISSLRIYLFIAGLLLVVSAQARQPAAIATAHPLATQAGERILQAGGNAFDVAVAVSAALAVVEPYSSGIGGGGFWLLHRQQDGKQIMIDGREIAPLAAHRDMYLDDKGQVIEGASIDGPLAAGIPGVPAALQHIAENYGRLPLAQSLQPAIELAREGFPVEEHYRRMAGFRLAALRASPDAARIFLYRNDVPPVGHVIRQPELATTLQAMADQGAAGFYRGRIGDRLVSGVRKAGGIWQTEDFRTYKVLERTPIHGNYRGMRITSVAPPSSGGIAMVEVFNQLAQFKLEDYSATRQVHLVVEAMRRAYRDRAQYLGDSDFVEVPTERLISSLYGAGLAATIHPDQATPSDLLPGVQGPAKARDTTHFSIIDHDGNRVAATLSINYPFGSGFVAPGTGVLLNDEMDDFSAKPGVPNVYGLVGAEANAIAPGKRMLSSMSPTFLELGDRVAVIGTPGGSRIITMVIIGSLAFFEGEDARSIVDRPRFHHQYLPDRIFLEPDAAESIDTDQLQLMGHQISVAERDWGNMQVVVYDQSRKRISAASDKRGLGTSIISK
mgnify:FL=1